LPVTLIVPVGIYVGRVIRGILEKIPMGISKIYLLIPATKDEWGEKTREHLKIILTKLGPLKDITETVEVKNFNDYGACFETLYNLVKISSENRDVKEILVDITSSTRMWTVAATAVASLFENAKVYYVKKGEPPEKLPLEKRYPKWAIDDEGAETIEIVPPYSDLNEILKDKVAQKILITLAKEKQQQLMSLKELAVKLGLIDINSKFPKKEKLKLRRKLSKLRKKGLIYITQYTGRALIFNLTLFGNMLASIILNNNFKKEESLSKRERS